MTNNQLTAPKVHLREILGETERRGFSIVDIINCLIVSIKVLLKLCAKLFIRITSASGLIQKSS